MTEKMTSSPSFFYLIEYQIIVKSSVNNDGFFLSPWI